MIPSEARVSRTKPRAQHRTQRRCTRPKLPIARTYRQLFQPRPTGNDDQLVNPRLYQSPYCPAALAATANSPG